MRNEQIQLVKQIGEMIGGADYVYFVSYSGLKVKDLSELRKQLGKEGAEFRVLKNTLIKKAAEALKIEGLDAVELTGGTAMVYGSGDPGAVAKVVTEFGKKNDKLSGKGGYLDGAVLGKADFGYLADLPAKPVLQAMLLGVLQAPSRNLVSVLNAKAASILNVLNAYHDKLENK